MRADRRRLHHSRSRSRLHLEDQAAARLLGAEDQPGRAIPAPSAQLRRTRRAGHVVTETSGCKSFPTSASSSIIPSRAPDHSVPGRESRLACVRDRLGIDHSRSSSPARSLQPPGRPTPRLTETRRHTLDTSPVRSSLKPDAFNSQPNQPSVRWPATNRRFRRRTEASN